MHTGAFIGKWRPEEVVKTEELIYFLQMKNNKFVKWQDKGKGFEILAAVNLGKVTRKYIVETNGR